jgi:hypothetical protein
VGADGNEEAEAAVVELRLFISLYNDADLRPDSRVARQLAAARRAVAAFDEAKRALDEGAA